MNVLRKEAAWVGLVLLVWAARGYGMDDSDKVSAHPPQRPRVLNNFVTELLVLRDQSPDGRQVFSVHNPRQGWLFVRVDAWAGRTGSLTVRVAPAADGGAAEETLAEYAPGDKTTREAMRYLPKGTYHLTVTGTDVALNSLTVRTIPAVIFANFPCYPHLPRFGRYDWAFLKRIGMLDSCNVIVTGDTSSPFVAEWLAQGRQLLQQAGVPGLRGNEPMSEQDAYDYWIGAAGMNDANVSGVIADEFYPSRADRFDLWVGAIKRVRRERPQKVFYPYIAGGATELKPFVLPLVDAGCRFAYERYLPEQRTEAEAKRHFQDRLTGEMIDFNATTPGFASQCIIVLGFLSGPNETLNKNPAVDYKVHTDMQMHLLATDEAFRGLYGVEEYLADYCDEEYLRWCAKLFRHYCIEGSTDRLSGDPYELNHIRNGDFEQGLQGWTVTPAADDSVEARTMPGYGWLQGRYPQTDQGDTFLWARRQQGKPNTISQQIVNLQPGRFYSVKMYTADYGDMTKWQIHAVSLRVTGARRMDEEEIHGAFKNCYSHHIEKFGDTNTYFNYHRVVFQATDTTARLTISDGGRPGQELMFNFIEVEPYLMPE